MGSLPQVLILLYISLSLSLSISTSLSLTLSLSNLFISHLSPSLSLVLIQKKKGPPVSSYLE